MSDTAYVYAVSAVLNADGVMVPTSPHPHPDAACGQDCPPDCPALTGKVVTLTFEPQERQGFHVKLYADGTETMEVFGDQDWERLPRWRRGKSAGRAKRA